MPPLSQLGLWAGSVGLGVLIIMALHIHRQFLRRLKVAFPTEWGLLGSPNLVNPEGSRAENSLFVFVLFGKFYRLNDASLNAHGKALRLCYLLSLVCLCLLFFSLRSG